MRAAIYFAIWIILAVVINRLSARWANSGDPAVKEKLKGLGAFGLIVYTITMSFAAIDWMLSLQPLWNSTAYGLIVIVGQLLSSLAFAVMVLNFVPGLGIGRSWNLRTTPDTIKDLGAIMLTFVMSWAYLAYFQLLIIWAADIPREISWYIARSEGGWQVVAILIAILLFASPFAILLSFRVRHNMRLLAGLSALIAVAYLINLYWEVIPAFHPSQFSLHWLDIVMPIGLGGLWVGAFLYALKKRPVLSEVEQVSLEAKTGHEHAVSGNISDPEYGKAA